VAQGKKFFVVQERKFFVAQALLPVLAYFNFHQLFVAQALLPVPAKGRPKAAPIARK
jgi:hypothetical protein